MEGITIHTVGTVGEVVEFQAIERQVWEGDELEIIPAHVLLTHRRYGGILLIARDAGGTGIGVLLGFPGIKNGQTLHCSHILGILPEWRSRDVGYMMKRRQRELVLEQGLDLIVWTFDPARNAERPAQYRQARRNLPRVQSEPLWNDARWAERRPGNRSTHGRMAYPPSGRQSAALTASPRHPPRVNCCPRACRSVRAPSCTTTRVRPSRCCILSTPSPACPGRAYWWKRRPISSASSGLISVRRTAGASACARRCRTCLPGGMPFWICWWNATGTAGAAATICWVRSRIISRRNAAGRTRADTVPACIEQKESYLMRIEAVEARVVAIDLVNAVHYQFRHRNQAPMHHRPLARRGCGRLGRVRGG